MITGNIVLMALAVIVGIIILSSVLIRNYLSRQRFVPPLPSAESMRPGSIIWHDPDAPFSDRSETVVLDAMDQTLNRLSLNLQNQLSQALQSDQRDQSAAMSNESPADALQRMGDGLANALARQIDAQLGAAIRPGSTFTPAIDNGIRLQVYEKILGKVLTGRQQISALKARLATKAGAEG